MKKDIIKLSFVALILIVISTIYIMFVGRTYTLKYDISHEYDINNYNTDIECTSGNVTILGKTIKDNKYLVKVKAKKAGKCFITLTNNDYSEMRLLYIHKSMVIYDNNYFGYSNGSEIIPINLSIFLVYLLFILYRRYKKYLNDNIYQYRNVAYLGIIIFLIIFIINNIITCLNYHGIYDTVDNFIRSTSFFSFVLLPLTIITFILVTISNIHLIIKEGISFKNLLGLFLGIFLCIMPFIPEYIYKSLHNAQNIDIYNLNNPGAYIYNFFESVVYLATAYLECILFSTIIISLKSVRKKINYNKDYIIILGCKIRHDGTLTPLLKGRVDKALKFRNDQLANTGKNIKFIASGGKGNDEIISEAEAISNYLIEKGIDKKDIILEDKSKNTYENIKYSSKLIKEKNANIAFSTTNYHVFRTGLIASSQGLVFDGIGSKTKIYFWINAFIREFIGTLYSEKKKHFIILILILIILILMIYVTYLANNI